MRQAAAAILTLIVLGLLVVQGLRRGAPEPAPATAVPTAVREPADPTSGAAEPVRALLASARKGQVDAYLDAFEGPLRARLEREVAERGRDAFAKALQQAAAARRSHALFAPDADGADAARVVVEAVYPDRNERQTYRVERGDRGWRVVGVDTVRTRLPARKYGSLATFEGPEGIPDTAPPAQGPAR